MVPLAGHTDSSQIAHSQGPPHDERAICIWARPEQMEGPLDKVRCGKTDPRASLTLSDRKLRACAGRVSFIWSNDSLVRCC